MKHFRNKLTALLCCLALVGLTACSEAKVAPTTAPTTEQTTSASTKAPTTAPTMSPTVQPTTQPTTAPMTQPTTAPTTPPTTIPLPKESKVEITCASGTKDAYKIEGETITFTSIAEKTAYQISGEFVGNIVIDVGDDNKFELELDGLSLYSKTACPIYIKSGDKVTITAKKGYENFVYDLREQIPEDSDEVKGAIYSKVDLEIGGKGALTVESTQNKGIHTKDDLTVKNLTLTVNCKDNALKGNDSVTVESGTLELIAKQGDGIKTENSDVSSKGNQRGTVSILSGNVTIYAACDGIDASYNVEIADGATVDIKTDKYSPYSEEVTKVGEIYYIRFTSTVYRYSIRYAKADGTEKWVNSSSYKAVQSGRSFYYYYTMDKLSGYDTMQLFVYASGQTQGQAETYLAATNALAINTNYDTIALNSSGQGLSYGWTNYTTATMGGGGFGGMSDGNTDKGDHSTKGIKADNEVLISGGKITVQAYDDAIHANSDVELENGEKPKGNVTVTGGELVLSSNDDGIHADGTLSISEGSVKILTSYEGLEGNLVSIAGGTVALRSTDDGINSTQTSGTGIVISGGDIYVHAGGDGLDSNSRTSYGGIRFEGGTTVVISTSSMNSSIDTEAGYTYTGGKVLAICPSGGMSNESTKCQTFSAVAKQTTKSLSANSMISVSVKDELMVSVKMPTSLNALVIYLGSNEATFGTAQAELNANGVYWKE